METINGLELFRVDLDDRQPIKVKDSWSDNSSLRHSFNIKEKIDNPEANSAYFYKYVFILIDDHATCTHVFVFRVTGTTQDEESCHFFSHPFYVDA